MTKSFLSVQYDSTVICDTYINSNFRNIKEMHVHLDLLPNKELFKNGGKSMSAQDFHSLIVISNLFNADLISSSLSSTRRIIRNLEFPRKDNFYEVCQYSKFLRKISLNVPCSCLSNNICV